jgi:hypothetical protein
VVGIKTCRHYAYASGKVSASITFFGEGGSVEINSEMNKERVPNFGGQNLNL